MTGFLIILGLYIGAHGLILWKYGLGGILGLYIMTFGAWLYFYGYDSSFADWLYTNLIVLAICTAGTILPRGPLGIAVGAVGGAVIGKTLSKL